ncbi:MAG TPA: hypothetical protein H9930_01905 [Candidatus Mediterraneibacter excrementipullorum]|nr:hypothetical protein [Candidatus Mediterraneibacter excrementipullorum]
MVEGKYFLDFDGNERLYQILLQEGGSRDQRFSVGMTREEVEEMTGPLEYTQEEGRVSWAAEPENGNYYGFFFYDGKVTSILECEEKTGFLRMLWWDEGSVLSMKRPFHPSLKSCIWLW